jgi:hypothetical protein
LPAIASLAAGQTVAVPAAIARSGRQRSKQKVQWRTRQLRWWKAELRSLDCVTRNISSFGAARLLAPKYLPMAQELVALEVKIVPRAQAPSFEKIA